MDGVFIHEVFVYVKKKRREGPNVRRTLRVGVPVPRQSSEKLLVGKGCTGCGSRSSHGRTGTRTGVVRVTAPES